MPLAEINFHQLFEGMREPLVLHRDGQLVHVNTAFCEMLGYETTELVGRRAIEFVHVEDREKVIARLHAAPPTERTHPTPEHRLVRMDGSSVHVDVYSVRVSYEGTLTFLSFVRDLTERKRVEAQLMTVDRLASLGRLAATVGHEINNPVAYVLATIEVMVRDLESGELPREALVAGLATIREGAERIRDIGRDLRTFVRDDRENSCAVDVHRVLDRCLEMAGHELRHRTQLVRRYDASRMVYANESRLQQVFLNLVINAAQAIQSGPRDAHEIVVTTFDDGIDRVGIEITDTGVGIAPDVLERAFEPFFTTKPVGVGTGLGLSISHHIVTSLGGTIAIAPRPDRGTCVCVSLLVAPVNSAALPTIVNSPHTPTKNARTANARLLIVDDEPHLTSALASLLDHHRVSTACGGREAIERLRHASFDLIVSDLHMAQVSGVDLYEHVHKNYPGLERRMIFMTGGAFTDRARAFLARAAPPVLRKPFALDALVAIVDDLMTSG